MHQNEAKLDMVILKAQHEVICEWELVSSGGSKEYRTWGWNLI